MKMMFNKKLRMMTYALNKVDDPVLLFDYDNKLYLFNTAAEKHLDLTQGILLEDYIKEHDLYFTLDAKKIAESKERTFTRTKYMNGRTYLIYGKALWDEMEDYMGTVIIYTDISNQEKLKDEATLYATRDQLTGLWNRDYFFDVAKRTIQENPDTEFLLIATDIYQFKLFNEILGADVGDDLLLAFAQAYRENYKRLWCFSRIAGDRFALLIPKKNYEEKVFMKILQDVISRKHYSMKVHCYVGVYEVVDRNLSIDSMYDRAFMALECIKGDMNQKVAYYQEEILKKRIYETNTLDELDQALEKGEFVIFLQPQVDIQQNKVVSAEALIRWAKPGRGIVSPAEFITIFENKGMIDRLDYHVWELACKQLHKWQEVGYMDRTIAVNISAKDFYLCDLYKSITGLVEKYHINPANLKLEITETAFVLDVKKQMQLVKKLQKYGFSIEIDDFGSGYSSLNVLKEIEVDVLKMDLKFFEKTDNKERADKIVKNIINMAGELGMSVIAEGVESDEDIRKLKAIGCQIVQGYYFAKPMCVADYEKFVEEYDSSEMKQMIDSML